MPDPPVGLFVGAPAAQAAAQCHQPITTCYCQVSSFPPSVALHLTARPLARSTVTVLTDLTQSNALEEDQEEPEMTATPGTRYIKPTKSTTIFNGAVAGLTRLGVSVWGSRVLFVRGRTSGEWRSTPVNL